MSFLGLPELRALIAPPHLLRLPPETDVPVTSRVLSLIDTPAFHRLGTISQLGLVRFVYPGANHTRLEHSLGVYRLALLFLARLSQDSTFCKFVGEHEAKLFLVAALLHDIGHWPYCHPIEDMRLPEIERHERLAEKLICEGQVADCLKSEWQLEPIEVARLLGKTIDESDASAKAKSLLAQMLSGPIDIDKMDYLQRDSLHAGVPYGRNFDQQRLLSSLCLSANGKDLALTEKGRTAAEMMVFARYVMFSEVYWHHAVRSATAMLQRAVFMMKDGGQLSDWQRMSESEMTADLIHRSQHSPTSELVEGLFGSVRSIYKRLGEFHVLEQPEIHARLARRSYPVLVNISSRLAERMSREFRLDMKPHHLLIDAPPAKLEVQFQVQIRIGSSGEYRSLGELSPVVKTLATDQFDNYVKRLRLFVAPQWKDRLRAEHQKIQHMLLDVISEADGNPIASVR